MIPWHFQIKVRFHIFGSNFRLQQPEVRCEKYECELSFGFSCSEKRF